MLESGVAEPYALQVALPKRTGDLGRNPGNDFRNCSVPFPGVSAGSHNSLFHNRGGGKKGRRKRLRCPDIPEVEAKRGVKLPQGMDAFYRSEIVERSDFYLAPPNSKQLDWWYIERFVPQTRRDLSEGMKVTNVPGIPIAFFVSIVFAGARYGGPQRGVPP
jgi:hypothetical protein